MNKDFLKLLDQIQEFEKPKEDGNRILIIDGLNLFLRNFAVLNYINHQGIHIGGLGGFLRSLGGLIKQLQPTSIYIIFDGNGSSINRKNLVPEYKAGRNKSQTNKLLYGKVEEENESKNNQIIRLIHYLKCLPVKIVCLDKVEADDVIAFLSKEISKQPKTKTFIISSDNDLLQLVDNKINIYRSVEKDFYNPQLVKEKFGVYPHNFIVYKTLIGDTSDNVGGVKGLGKKKIFKLFPELSNEEIINLDNIFNICEKKYKEHIIYAQIISDFNRLKDAYKIMDLSNPMLDEYEKHFVKEQIDKSCYELDIPIFTKLYNEDGLENILKNINYWLRENWVLLDRYNKAKNI